jgi:hypothetical protein
MFKVLAEIGADTFSAKSILGQNPSDKIKSLSVGYFRTTKLDARTLFIISLLEMPNVPSLDKQ